MSDGPVVETTSGLLRGKTKQGPDGSGSANNSIELFAGVPYAAPPVGERRFAPPAAVESWTGVRDANRFGKAAPQLPGDGLTSAVPLAWDEATCLTLNVCTPSCDDARRPVMVWIHGGDFKHGMGAIPWYNGARFATNGDVVVVSLNYRMGAFGFLRLDHLDPALAGSGVAGNLDQKLALKWVQDNIASFGGDPANVTVFGESAGAFSVATLLAMPHTQGLFHKAILQSGAGHCAHTGDQAAAITERLMAAAGVGSIDELRAIDAEALLVAQQTVEAMPHRDLGLESSPFYPSVDGTVLAQRPIDAFAAGAAADIPVLLGTNADETKLWGVQAMVDEAKLERFVGRYRPDAAHAIEQYRSDGDAPDAGEVAVQIGTDFMFRVPAVRMAEARTGAASWMYHFDWKSTAFNGALGACHALEVPFVFDNLHQPGISAFAGEDPPQALADAMHECWISFARTGSPTTARTDGWRPYDAADRTVQEFGDELRVLRDPRSAQLASWAGLR